MKLIIDIPDISYKWVKTVMNREGAVLFDEIYQAVGEGIPLEDIKAEIQGNYPLYLCPNPYEQAINDVLQILDKHIKENKE